MDALRAVLFDYNLLVVLAGTSLLGLACGVVGAFLVLRRRALLADVLGHATLPGVVGAWMLWVAMGSPGRPLPVLLAGGALAAVVAVAMVAALRAAPRLREDAALAITLSATFGLGIVLLSLSQQVEGASAAGLKSFIYGKAASMVAADARLIGGCALVAVVLVGLLFKELRLLCFDPGFAVGMGYPVGLLDGVLMGLAVMVTVAGLQAVGLLLVVALMIIPAAAARFWSDRLSVVVVVAGGVGLLSGMVGTVASAIVDRLPSGPAIVLAATGFFAVSLIAGPARGLGTRWRHAVAHRRAAARAHLLRDVAELAHGVHGVHRDKLAAHRDWRRGELDAAIRWARRAKLLGKPAPGVYILRPEGAAVAARIAARHELWVRYLLAENVSDLAHAQLVAEEGEHLLDEELAARLEADVASAERGRA
jgi:manganese/zinc/iron transport system permease protein